jgi:uncharacterized protein YkwD
MSRISTSHSAVFITAFLSAAGIVASASCQLLAQTTASPQSGTTETPKSADKTSGQTGVWHHFGESQTAPPAQQRPSGEWRHFGEGNEPAHLPGPLARQGTYANHIRELELQMFALLNRDRMDPANVPETKGKAFPLQWNDRLAGVARAHSQDMLNQRFFDHVDPQGRSPAMRIKAMGMDWQAVGENIAIHSTIPGAQAAFMNEPRFRQNHRANILSAKYTDVGIGIVQGLDGRYYITQDFYAAPSAPGSR